MEVQFSFALCPHHTHEARMTPILPIWSNYNLGSCNIWSSSRLGKCFFTAEPWWLVCDYFCFLNNVPPSLVNCLCLLRCLTTSHSSSPQLFPSCPILLSEWADSLDFLSICLPKEFSLLAPSDCFSLYWYFVSGTPIVLEFSFTTITFASLWVRSFLS